jgi:low temperature requirement protein LtrA
VARVREGDRQAEYGQRVTPLELFFDLVVVFAITQVTSFLSRSPTWEGLLRAFLLLGMLSGGPGPRMRG